MAAAVAVVVGPRCETCGSVGVPETTEVAGETALAAEEVAALAFFMIIYSLLPKTMQRRVGESGSDVARLTEFSTCVVRLAGAFTLHLSELAHRGERDEYTVALYYPRATLSHAPCE